MLRLLENIFCGGIRIFLMKLSRIFRTKHADQLDYTNSFYTAVFVAVIGRCVQLVISL